MANFYLYLSSQDSLDVRKNNNPSEFLIQLPKSYTLDGNWTCAVTEITLTCDFSPRSKRLYLCCDIVEETCVRGTLLPVLRSFEIETKYKRQKYKEFKVPAYLPVTITHLNSLRFYVKDENLNTVEFNTNDLHCVLHLKRHGFGRSV